MKKKKEAEKIVLKDIKKEFKSISEIRAETKLAYTTIKDIVNRLKGKKVEETLGFDKSGAPTKRYRSLIDKDIADSDYLKFLIQNYESSTLAQDRYKQIQIKKDILKACQHKKIRDEEFIKFLIKYSKKKEHWKLDFENENIYQEDNGFWLFLGTIATNLLRDIEIDKKDNATKEKSLLKLIRSTGVFFEKVVFNRSRMLTERELALDALKLMRHQKRHDIAFKLLEKIDTKKKLEYYDVTNNHRKIFTTELDAFRRDIEFLIFSYNKDNPTDCRKRLYDILDDNLGSIKPSHGSKKSIIFTDKEMKLRKEIMYLLDMTREQQYR